MITRVDLRHFKCFSLLRLSFRSLTMLSGTNAAGKSSVLQALAVLHQTICDHEWSKKLMLNGAAVRLGTVADVVDQVEGRRSLEIALWDDDEEHRWWFSGERTEMSMEVRRVRIGDSEVDTPDALRWLFPLEGDDGLAERQSHPDLVAKLRNLCYLTAERLGPRDQYAMMDPQETDAVGPGGEHTASVLYAAERREVLDSLVLEGHPRTWTRQVEARMGTFFPRFELEVVRLIGTSTVRLGVRTSSDTNFHRPGHTGFGLMQVLPVVVAALSCDVDDLLLVENPEAHLHPAGQTKMGMFLGEVAAAGVQVVVETHSDHVLNGVRRAVKDGRLKANRVALHFFRSRGDAMETGRSQVESPDIDEEGNIDEWPDGFFDQFDKDMNYLAGWS